MTTILSEHYYVPSNVLAAVTGISFHSHDRPLKGVSLSTFLKTGTEMRYPCKEKARTQSGYLPRMVGTAPKIMD